MMVLYFVSREGAGSFRKAVFDTLLLMVSGLLKVTPLIFLLCGKADFHGNAGFGKLFEPYYTVFLCTNDFQ
jgi:hypothetical protein